MAVLAVLAVHAWPELLRGGFVGVDVFFVLSGFFITGLLIRERLATGGLSFQYFYVRRVKRILPSAPAGAMRLTTVPGIAAAAAIATAPVPVMA